MEQCQINWLGHSCFQVVLEDFCILFDPYQDGYIPGYAPLHANAHLILCSHDHLDHNATQNIRQLPQTAKNPFRVTDIATDHDMEQGCLRGKNTIRLLESQDLRIAHFGDIGHPLTPAQSAQLTNLDVAMIPVGGYYTIGPEEARDMVAQLHPKIVIPMHYRAETFGFPPLATVDEFLSLDGNCIWYPGNTVSVTKASQPHVAVLKYQSSK